MSTHRSVQERSPADDGRPERATTASGALTELLEIAAESLGGHTALVCGDERVGYDELAERVARLAHGLAGLGVSPGDRVALVMRDTPAFVVSFLAVAGLQARVVPLNPHFKRRSSPSACATVACAPSSRTPTRRACAATWCPPGTRASRSSPPVRRARARQRSRD